MGLVHDNQIILREIIHQSVWWHARRESGKVAGIVLNTGTKACFTKHLNIKRSTLTNALRLNIFFLTLKELNLFLCFRLNLLNRSIHFFLVHNIMGRRENHNMLQAALNLAGQYIDLCNPVKKFYANCRIIRRNRKNLHNITTHPEGASLKIHVISCILDVNQTPEHIIAVLLHPRSQGNRHVLVVNRATKSVDTGNARHNNDISALRQSRRSRVTQLINLIVDVRILFNVRIRRRHISLRLVIIVIGHKIFYRILREKFFKLTIKLGRKCLIMCNNQRRLIQCGNNIRHRKGLTGTGNSQKCLELVPLPKTIDQCFDCLRLVSGRLKIGM